MLENIHGRLSIGARLMMVSGAFVASSAIAIAIVAGNNLDDKAFSEKEADGAHRLDQVWTALNGAPEKGVDILAPGNKADAGFSSEDERDAFLSARSPDARLQAAATYISAISDGSNLTLDPELDSYYAMDAIVFRLPDVLVNIQSLEQAVARQAPAA